MARIVRIAGIEDETGRRHFVAPDVEQQGRRRQVQSGGVEPLEFRGGQTLAAGDAVDVAYPGLDVLELRPLLPQLRQRRRLLGHPHPPLSDRPAARQGGSHVITN
jgi:hypothetical protein